MSEVLDTKSGTAKELHRPYRIIIAILCGVIFFYDPAVYGMYAATYEAMVKWSNKGARLSRRVLKPDVGLLEISSPAFYLVRIVRQEKLKEFSISPGLYADPLALQRLTEGAWPARIEPTSKNYFMLPSEQHPGDCIVRSYTHAVMYVTCK